MIESKVLHRGKFLEFRIDTVERAVGSRATRDIAGHPGAVAIVALVAEVFDDIGSCPEGAAV